jgi:predicted anti-sigma-YlaC factor YlaD
MNPRTVLGAVLAVVLLVNVAIGEMRMALTLLPLHVGLGAVAFAISVTYAYVGRRFRPALALGALLSVLTGLQGALGLAMLLYHVENPVETVHRFNGSATFLIGLVGGILVGRAARRAQGR